MAEQDPRELIVNVERLLEEIEQLPDPPAREKATAIVQTLLELYGAGLERIVEEVSARDDGEIAAALADDELVSHLLLLHGLHPVGVQDRVLGALNEVRPYLESHGGDVELLAIEDSAVRLRLAGSCHGCPSSTMTLKLAIENAIRKAAPEIEQVIAEGEQEPVSDSGLIQIEIAGGGGASPHGGAAAGTDGHGDGALEGAWTMVGGLRELAGGGTVVKPIAGAATLFASVGGRFYAYRPSCPACEGSLAEAILSGGELACPGCGNRYDLLRAGRCLDSPSLHLEPVPLLVGDDGLVKVALPVTV